MKCSMDQNNRADAVDGPVVSEGELCGNLGDGLKAAYRGG
jgi:hypothetical protein